MTQIVLNIKDSKVGFFLELVRNFDFVKVEKEGYSEPTKDEIKESITQGLKEVQLIEQGKMKATPLKDFLNEL
ncbi:MAG: hypothetical protein JXB34_13300 [Bacteroidales bacterium]|nr:hypothetical protein [Bacteroidales bacterium]